MTFTLMFKTPDVLDQLHNDFYGADLEEAMRFAEKFVKYGECIKIVFDTEKQTVTGVK